MSEKLTIYDRLECRAPVDRQARMMLSGPPPEELKGPNVPKGYKGYAHCPPLLPPPSHMNLTGLMVGRMVVLGYFGQGKWVVRCACGQHETRKEKYFSREERVRARCLYCAHTLQLRKRGHPDHIKDKIEMGC